MLSTCIKRTQSISSPILDGLKGRKTIFVENGRLLQVLKYRSKEFILCYNMYNLFLRM